MPPGAAKLTLLHNSLLVPEKYDRDIRHYEFKWLGEIRQTSIGGGVLLEMAMVAMCSNGIVLNFRAKYVRSLIWYFLPRLTGSHHIFLPGICVSPFQPSSLRIEGTPVSYKTGDSLAVWPRNPLDKVEAGPVQSF